MFSIEICKCNAELVILLLYGVDVEIDDNEIRIKGMNGDYLSVTPDDVELYDYKWNGVSIKAQTSSKVISRGEGKYEVN